MIVHKDKIRWLFWLRWKMFIRSFNAQNPGQAVGSAFLLLLILFLGGGLAVGTYFGYRFIPAPGNTELLFVVLSGLFLLWIILPLLEYTTNEGLDISKLVFFPLTRAELMVSLVASTLLDIPTLGLFLVLGTVIVAWSYSFPMALLSLVTMIVFYVQLIAASQLVLALLQGVLRSRRFRDLSIILIILLSSSGYLCQFVFRGNVGISVVESFMQGQYSLYLRWFPGGMAASTIQQAMAGNWGLSLLWLLTLAIITFVFLYLWQALVERGLTASDSGGAVKSRRQAHNRATGIEANEPARTATSSQTALGRLLTRVFPQQVRALVGKDLKYYWRDPQLKALLLQSLISVVFLIAYLGVTLLGNGGESAELQRFGSYAVLVAPLLLMLTLFSLSYNTLGFERQSISTLLLFPVRPQAILWAKNVATFVIGLGVGTILIILVAIITHGWLLVGPAFVLLIAGTCINIGGGNFISVMFPQKMRMARRGMFMTANQSAQGGCLRALISMVAFYATVILLLPIAAAILAPIFFNVLWIWAISLPISLAYGITIYVLITYLAAPRILTKAPELIEIIGKE